MIGYSLEDKNLTQEIIEEYEEILNNIDNYSTTYFIGKEIITLTYNNKIIVYVYDYLDNLQELYVYDNIFELARDWREA